MQYLKTKYPILKKSLTEEYGNLLTVLYTEIAPHTDDNGSYFNLESGWGTNNSSLLKTNMLQKCYMGKGKVVPLLN
jgi:hypothetical protein